MKFTDNIKVVTSEKLKIIMYLNSYLVLRDH